MPRQNSRALTWFADIRSAMDYLVSGLRGLAENDLQQAIEYYLLSIGIQQKTLPKDRTTSIQWNKTAAFHMEKALQLKTSGEDFWHDLERAIHAYHISYLFYYPKSRFWNCKRRNVRCRAGDKRVIHSIQHSILLFSLKIPKE